METQAFTEEMQRFKPNSTKIKELAGKEANWVAFVVLWCFPSHHRDNMRWEAKVTLCLKVDSQCTWT